MKKVTKEKIQKWIKDSVNSMLAKDDGAVYYYRIKDGISFMLAWIDGTTTDSENKFSAGQFTLEASVRKSDSSFMVEDWTYIEKGVSLQTSDEANSFTAVVDWIFKVATNHLKRHIYFMLPNNQQIDLLDEMHTANYDFGDFDIPIVELRRTYYEVTDEETKATIEQEIEAQCFAFANFLGTQYEDLQSLMCFDDLFIGIKQALIGNEQTT